MTFAEKKLVLFGQCLIELHRDHPDVSKWQGDEEIENDIFLCVHEKRGDYLMMDHRDFTIDGLADDVISVLMTYAKHGGGK